MDIIGRHLLADFWRDAPESESALRGLLAIIAASDWRSDGDFPHQFGSAVASEGEGRVVVTDPDGQFFLTLRVNYARQLVHIISIQGG